MDTQKNASRKHYQNHKAEYKARAVQRRVYLKGLVEDIKRDKPCMDCEGVFPSVCMDFDHRPSEVKIADIARLVIMGNEPKLLAEIKKCDLICANCHRKRTHLQRRLVE